MELKDEFILMGEMLKCIHSISEYSFSMNFLKTTHIKYELGNTDLESQEAQLNSHTSMAKENVVNVLSTKLAGGWQS